MNKKKWFRLLSILFIGGAVLLIARNTYLDVSARKRAEQVVAEIKEEQVESESFPVEEKEQLIFEKEVNGEPFIGYLEIPKLNKEIPVTAEWDEELLKEYANLYSGRYYTDPLIIMATNYKAYFGEISTLEKGDQVFLVDVVGRTRIFQVEEKEVIDGSKVEEIRNDYYPLTIFTSTLDGRDRFVLRLSEITE